MAPVICDMDFAAASLAESPSRSISACVFSTTTMASSTSDPMTRINPNIVNTFIVKPNMYMNVNVPTRDTGMAMAGTNVARTSCMKRYVMATTSRSATMSVMNVSFRNTLVNAVVSSASTPTTPAGIRLIHLSISTLTRSAVATAFASGVLYTESETAGFSLNLVRTV